MSKSDANQTAGSTSAANLAKLRSQGRFVGTFLGGMVGWLILQNAAKWILTHAINSTTYKEWFATAFGAVIGFLVGGAAAKLLATYSERRLVRPFGLAVSLVFVVMWLLPILWVGGSKKSTPGMPYYMQNLHRVSCLFTHSSKDWKTVHYQIRFEGSDEWVEGFEPDIFPQSIFGYRGRFNRIVGQSLRGGARGGGRRWEVAKHIQTRWKELYPNDPAITHVRYVRVVHPVYESHCMANEPWLKRNLSTYPENRYRYEDTIDLTKPYRYKPKPEKKKKSKKTKKSRKQTAAAKKKAAAKAKAAKARGPKNALPAKPSLPKRGDSASTTNPTLKRNGEAAKLPLRPLRNQATTTPGGTK